MDEIDEIDGLRLENEPVGYIGEQEVQVERGLNLSVPREIRIQSLNSGYLVNVGCQTVAVETTEKLIKALGAYLKDPNGYEEEWNKNTNRSKI